MILKALAVGPFASNCYLVGSETSKKGIIIDPGAEADTILDAVSRLGLTIEQIVVTHSHIDHVAALKEVKESTGADFVIHEDEAESEMLQGLGRQLSGLMGTPFESLPKPDRLLHGGDVIEVDGLRFTILHTPGHSPGGISLLGDGVVFTGDTLFNFGIGRTDFPGCSYSQLMDSIQTKLMVLPDETVVLPGHGSQTTIGTERQWNSFLR